MNFYHGTKNSKAALTGNDYPHAVNLIKNEEDRIRQECRLITDALEKYARTLYQDDQIPFDAKIAHFHTGYYDVDLIWNGQITQVTFDLDKAEIEGIDPQVHSLIENFKNNLHKIADKTLQPKEAQEFKKHFTPAGELTWKKYYFKTEKGYLNKNRPLNSTDYFTDNIDEAYYMEGTLEDETFVQNLQDYMKNVGEFLNVHFTVIRGKNGNV